MEQLEQEYSATYEIEWRLRKSKTVKVNDKMDNQNSTGQIRQHATGLLNHSRHWNVITQTSCESNKTKSQIGTSKSNSITSNSTGISEGITSSGMEGKTESLKRKRYKQAKIRKRRNQRKIPTPKTEVGKHQTNNQVLIP